MVQVDVLWAYGISAGMAVAASRQLRERHRAPERPGSPPPERLWQTPWFVATLLFLALLFAPSGIYLLWEFPSWETMHAGDRSLPGWLVVTFAIANVTQGLLGFWVVDRLLARGRAYLAYLQPLLAYFGMFFVLVHGWDGEGYERFFSATAADYRAWDGDWTAWLGSDVALTLYVMGAILIPVIILLAVRWQTEGRATPGPAAVVALLLAGIFGVGLGSAVAASVLIHALGPALGALAFAVAAWLLVLRPGSGAAWWLFRRSALDDAPAPAPAAPSAPARLPRFG